MGSASKLNYPNSSSDFGGRLEIISRSDFDLHSKKELEKIKNRIQMDWLNLAYFDTRFVQSGDNLKISAFYSGGKCVSSRLYWDGNYYRDSRGLCVYLALNMNVGCSNSRIFIAGSKSFNINIQELKRDDNEPFIIYLVGTDHSVIYQNQTRS